MNVGVTAAWPAVLWRKMWGCWQPGHHQHGMCEWGGGGLAAGRLHHSSAGKSQACWAHTEEG